MGFTTKLIITNNNSYKPAPTTYSFRQVAEILDLGVGRNKLMELLREAGILNHKGIPYEKYVSDGYFSFREKMSYKYSFPAASVVGKKGLEFIKEQLKNF
ncbi:MAG: phage antirepressor KilAC domain-containing protein [Marinifilaceae bacterium]|nr:phage antirepressor KilAC domain-containing protein [Marinifilaceae bacterium]